MCCVWLVNTSYGWLCYGCDYDCFDRCIVPGYCYNSNDTNVIIISVGWLDVGVYGGLVQMVVGH